jgi:beta-lactamase class A
VPITSQLEFTCADLTATPQMVVTSAPPWAGASAGTGDAVLTKLSAEVYDYLLRQKFAPNTTQQGSVFLMDLRTRNAIVLNPGVAYSGMSLVKIPILAALYRKLNAIPNETQANLIGEMMVCSDNLASNGVLNIIGDGNGYTGATRVNELMQGLNLKDTFMVGPFRDDPKVTPQPVNTIKTSANQTSTDPDPFNQATPADLGWLLSSIYQCALDGTGPLMTTYPGDFNSNECRQMVRALSADKIGTLVEAGVPPGTVVAHKHGWIDDTHGDAALVLTPGGDYVITVILYGKTWLSSDVSFPVVSEISRMTYNAYNPNKPVDAIRLETVPATCTPDPALIRDLRASSLPPIR